MTEPSRVRRVLRACIAVVLLITLSIMGYRRGYHSGYDVQEPLPTATGLLVTTYPVGDLVKPIAESADAEVSRTVSDFDPLIDLIVSTVEHESWVANGTGEGEINPFPTNLSLVISQTPRVHEQVADLLQQLRRLQEDIAAKDVIPFLQSCAAYGKGASHAFGKFPASDKGTAAANKLFGRAVKNLAAFWGSPTFNGEPTAEDFPSWSHAHCVATWPRGSGEAYLAVEDDPTAGRALVAGWRRAERALNATIE